MLRGRRAQGGRGHPRRRGAQHQRQPLCEASGEGPTSFADLGLCEPLVEACTRLGWKRRRPFSAEAIPFVFPGRAHPTLLPQPQPEP